MAVFKSFCGSLSLQAGVVILAAALIQIAIVILIKNFHVMPLFPTSLIFVLVFVLVLLIVGVVMISAAYKEKRSICMMALLLLVLLIILFLVGSIISFSNQKSLTDMVCVSDRCPETLWCASLSYRQREGVGTHGDLQQPEEQTELEYRMFNHRLSNKHLDQPIEELEASEYHRRRRDDNFPNKDGEFDAEESKYLRKRREDDGSSSTNTTKSTENATLTIDSNTTSSGEPIQRPGNDQSNGDDDNHTTKSPEDTEEGELLYGGDEYTGYDIGVSYIAALVLCVINAIFFLFCALIVYSYANELKYTSIYKI